MGLIYGYTNHALTTTSVYNSYAIGYNVYALDATEARFGCNSTLDNASGSIDLYHGRDLVVSYRRGGYFGGLDFGYEHFSYRGELIQRGQDSLKGYVGVATRFRVSRVLGGLLIGGTLTL